MKIRLYAVYDSASGVYDGPFPNRAHGEAIRNFTNAALNKDGPIGRNPEHFSLWHVGMYDDSIGEVVGKSKDCLGYALDFIRDATSESYGGSE